MCLLDLCTRLWVGVSYPSPLPDTNMDITTLGLCVSAICSTMKAYFKLLPEPLIGDSIAARILVVNCKSPVVVGSQPTAPPQCQSLQCLPVQKSVQYYFCMFTKEVWYHGFG